MDEKRKKFTEASRLEFTNSPGTHSFNYFERHWKFANRDMHSNIKHQNKSYKHYKISQQDAHDCKTNLYPARSGSLKNSRRSIPSVMYCWKK